MKKFYSLMILTGLGHMAIAQCNSSIPPDAIVITSLQTITANNGHYWVCSGTLNITGNGNTLYVESEAGASVTGSNNTINSQAIVVSQSEDGNGSNTIYVSNPDHALSTNFEDQINGCSAVVFNYSNAPAGGCAGGTGIEDTTGPILLEMFPNPVQNELNLVVENASRIDHVRILNVQGQTVLEQQGNFQMKLDVSTLPAGSYVVVINTDRGQMIRKVRKDQ